MWEKIGSILTVLFVLFMTLGTYFWFDEFANLIATF